MRTNALFCFPVLRSCCPAVPMCLRLRFFCSAVLFCGSCERAALWLLLCLRFCCSVVALCFPVCMRFCSAVLFCGSCVHAVLMLCGSRACCCHVLLFCSVLCGSVVLRFCSVVPLFLLLCGFAVLLVLSACCSAFLRFLCEYGSVVLLSCV